MRASASRSACRLAFAQHGAHVSGRFQRDALQVAAIVPRGLRGAPMRWPSRAGCRGTGSAAASSICGPAPRAGRRTRIGQHGGCAQVFDRAQQRFLLAAAAFHVPLRGQGATVQFEIQLALPDEAFLGRRSLQAADAPCRRSHSALRCSPLRRLRGSRSGAGAPSCCAWGPPPPSPKPKSRSERSERSLSWKFFSA